MGQRASVQHPSRQREKLLSMDAQEVRWSGPGHELMNDCIRLFMLRLMTIRLSSRKGCSGVRIVECNAIEAAHFRTRPRQLVQPG
jgi:hypothetical protein